MFAIECDGRSVGLIQGCRLADYGSWAATVAHAGLAFPEAAGLHYMIGEVACVGRGLGGRLDVEVRASARRRVVR